MNDRGHNWGSASNQGKRGNKGGSTYYQQNVAQLKTFFGSALDEQTICDIFNNNQHDMQKTISDLTTLTGIDPLKDLETKSSQNSNSTNDAQIEEIKGDLFSCPDTDSLAHCVSRDLRMGKGIAVLFKDKFGGVDNLKAQNKDIGSVAILQRGNRWVYYLITKEHYWNKPTYDSLKATLLEMKQHCLENGVQAISMPRLGITSLCNLLTLRLWTGWLVMAKCESHTEGSVWRFRH